MPEGSGKVFQSTSPGGRDGRGPAVNLANAADQSGGYGERELPPGRRKDIGFVALTGAFQDGPRPETSMRWATGSPFPPTAPGRAARTTLGIRSPAWAPRRSLSTPTAA